MFYRQHCAYDVNSAQKLFRLSCWPAGSATTFGASSALKSAVKLSPTEFRAMKVASGAHFLDAAHPCPSQKLSQIMSNHSAYSTLSDFIWLPDFIWFYHVKSLRCYLILSDFLLWACCIMLLPPRMTPLRWFTRVNTRRPSAAWETGLEASIRPASSSHVKYRCSVQNEADEYMNLYETWSNFIKLFMIVHYIN